jgi:hypothetical protein
MRPGEGTACAPLPHLQQVHHAHGPPLPLGRQLRRKTQPQILHTLPLLCHSNILLTQIGLLIVAVTFTVDWLNGGFYAKQHKEVHYYTYYFACITSYMLASSIGFLFVTQMLTACRNITTLESFTEGIYEKVDLLLDRTPSIPSTT